MIGFIDDYRGAHGVEPICKVLPIAPSTYHAHGAKRRDPAKLSARAGQDAVLKIEVRRVFDQNFRVYGVRKVWRQLKREAFDVARCTVSRLMRDMGLQAVTAASPSEPRSATRSRHARWITSIASSRRQGRMLAGSPTLPMSRPGAASSMSPSSSTFSRHPASAARRRRTPSANRSRRAPGRRRLAGTAPPAPAARRRGRRCRAAD